MNNSPAYQLESGSFRDPGGFLFYRGDILYRQINADYRVHYDLLMESGLYQSLRDAGLLIAHQEVALRPARPESAYKIIQPEKIPFISYPYEWCFSQLKNAALATLAIQKRALRYGMSLKDASAYNIQFRNGRPVLIDTLSFEKYRQGEPWVAYRQFCQHFLAPLALMSHRDVRLSQLLRVHLDGIPLDLAASLLPFRTRFQLALGSHIHLHATTQRHFAKRAPARPRRSSLSLLSFLSLIDSLESAVNRLQWQPRGTEWSDYYDETNYSEAAFEEKQRLVGEWLNQINPRRVWDLGANQGVFSRLASGRGIEIIALDSDPAAVEKNYLTCLAKQETALLPLWLDLTNPSSGIGWENRERLSLIGRGPADLVLALALIHHLAISNNLPLRKIAEFLSRIGPSLILEFVPKNDSQVQKLLATRDDIFSEYTQEALEAEFGQYFTILASRPLGGSERTLYLMKRRDP